MGPLSYAMANDRNEADSQGLHIQELLYPGIIIIIQPTAHLPAVVPLVCVSRGLCSRIWEKEVMLPFYPQKLHWSEEKTQLPWCVHQTFWAVNEGQLLEHCANLWHASTSSFSSLDCIACMPQQNSGTSKMFRKCWRQILHTWVFNLAGIPAFKFTSDICRKTYNWNKNFSEGNIMCVVLQFH